MVGCWEFNRNISALIGFKFADYVFTDEIALILQPPLAGLRKLELVCCKWEDFLLRKLPSWSPELLQLDFMAIYRQNIYERIMIFDGLHQSYGKLMTLSLYKVNDIQNNSRNPDAKSTIEEIKIHAMRKPRRFLHSIDHCASTSDRGIALEYTERAKRIQTN